MRAKRLAVVVVTGSLAGLAALAGHIAGAQQAAREMRTVLLNADLAGVAGYEVRMWRTDLGPGVVGTKHYHPGTECIYALQGALDLEKVGETVVRINAGEAHCVPPKTVLIPRNASATELYRSLVVMITPKGQPLAVPVK